MEVVYHNKKVINGVFISCITDWTQTKAMFTMYRTVKRSVAESVPDRASVHNRNAAFEAVYALEQYCSAPYRIGF